MPLCSITIPHFSARRSCLCLSARSTRGGSYGNQRLWGAIGFGLASLLGGYVSDASDGRFWGTILVFGGLMVATFAAFSSLSFDPAEKKARSLAR